MVEITRDLFRAMVVLKIEVNPRKSIFFRFQDIEAGVAGMTRSSTMNATAWLCLRNRPVGVRMLRIISSPQYAARPAQG